MSDLLFDSFEGLSDDSVQVLVVDRQPLTRLGLGLVLRRESWVAHCLLATGIEDALIVLTRHRPDVAIVHVAEDDPGNPGVGSQLDPLRAACASMPIVLASYHQRADQAPLLGGFDTGVLTADMSVEEVVGLVRATLIGEQVPARAVDPLASQLSAREREVLALLCTGATNPEIAARLKVGTDTVKKHAGALYRKLGVRNRTEAAQRAKTLLVV
jgi:DNA-binding NarL/FixJ family response regulator